MAFSRERARAGVVALTMGILAGSLGDPTQAQGLVEHLTPETKAEAIACGRSGPFCAITSYQLCPGTIGYVASVVTPFSRVAMAAYDDVRGVKPLGRVGPASVNRWGIAVSVSPAADVAIPSSIEGVEIRRGEDAIQPQKTTLGPVAVTIATGKIVLSTRGFFAFPASALQPGQDVSIIFRGSNGETVCHLDASRLRSLR